MNLRKHAVVLLFLLAGAAAVAQEYSIAGRVVSAATGSPMAGAVMSLSRVEEAGPDASLPRPSARSRGGPGQRQGPGQGFDRNPQRTTLAAVTTGEDGSFRFEHLPAAKYSLVGTKRGYLTTAYEEHSGFSTAIVTGPGLLSEGLTFQLSPGAVIAGTVSDASGDPIEQATVVLFRQQDDGFAAIKQFRTANVDDAGGYEFTHVPAGTYFLGVSGRVWYATPPAGNGAAPSDLDLAYPLSFYADTTDSASATPIPVKGGEHLSVDLPLHAVPAAHVTLPAPPRGDGGGRDVDAGFPVATQKAFGEPLMLRPQEGFPITRPGDRGSSISYSVAPGQYQVEMGGRVSTVDASGDTHFDPAAGAAMATVSGKIALARGGALPEGSSVVLRHAGSSSFEERAEIAEDGTFTLERMQPDTYEVEVHGDGRTYAVAQMAAKGAEVDGIALKLGSEAVTVAATVAPATSVVTGFVRQDGKGHGGAMVVLVPKHAQDRGLYRRDQSDSDGSFVLPDVAPGEYTVVAIENGWDLEWARPAVMARYLPRGLAVTVGEGAKVAVKEDVAVQSR